MTIIRDSICLVLGAGASKPYELPLGLELREDILGLKGDRLLRKAAGLDEVPNPMIVSNLDVFIDTFRYSGINSIDAFLARNTKYIDIGKLAIAYSILRREVFDNLIRNNPGEDWYQYFWNKISDVNWDDFDVSNISIITFNYDRSLEKYLTVAALNTYGKSLTDIREKLSKMKIIHVYGSLGPAWPWEDNYLEYGGNITPDTILKASRLIEVIPEARDTSPKLDEAKKLLKSANKIAFLGFGFDSLNMQRLDMKESCKVNFLTNIGWMDRIICFTCYGLELEEVLSIASGLDPKLRQKHGVGYPHAFYKDGCKTFLRKIQFF